MLYSLPYKYQTLFRENLFWKTKKLDTKIASHLLFTTKMKWLTTDSRKWNKKESHSRNRFKQFWSTSLLQNCSSSYLVLFHRTFRSAVNKSLLGTLALTYSCFWLRHQFSSKVSFLRFRGIFNQIYCSS